MEGGDVYSASSSGMWRNGGMDEVFSRSLSRRGDEDDDEEALKCAALERFPMFDRLRKGILTASCGGAEEIDVLNLGFQEKKKLLERLVRVAEEDNESFLLKLKNRIESGAEYVRKEVPLFVLPSSSLLNVVSPLTSFTDLQRVIYEEERAAYVEAIRQNMRDGKAHPLTFIRHTSTYQASMCELMEYCLSPAIRVPQDRVRENEIRVNKSAFGNHFVLEN